VSLAKSRPAKRQRKPTQPFEQGVNPAPLTPPPTARRPVRSMEPSQRSRTRTPIRSPLCESEASQLATDAQAAAILGEDDDEEEELAAAADDEEDEQIRWTLEAATAVEPGVVAAERSITEELEELVKL
jgi:hypothetical protein